MNVVSGGFGNLADELPDSLQGWERGWAEQDPLVRSQILGDAGYEGDYGYLDGSTLIADNLPGYDDNTGLFYDRSGHSHRDESECRSHHVIGGLSGGAATGAAVGGVAGTVFPAVGNLAGVLGGATYGAIVGGLYGVERANAECG